MKVAISSEGPSLESPVDARFGRAACFIVADTETGAFETLPNEQNLAAPQGAGVQAASAVAGREVEAVLTGHCGPKAFRVLAAAGIRIYVGAKGTVAQALEQLKAGKLTPADQPDVEGHWM
jgi:predicted Fe-Mo cluster-binding NifX family protein